MWLHRLFHLDDRMPEGPALRTRLLKSRENPSGRNGLHIGNVRSLRAPLIVAIQAHIGDGIRKDKRVQ